MELTPCPGCRRHVVVEASRCPFCATALPIATPRCGLPAGRWSRAAVFASASIVGCYSGPEPQTARTIEPQRPPPQELQPGPPGDDPHFAQPPPPPPDPVQHTGTIVGFVMERTAHTAVPGVRVLLLDAASTEVAQTSTGANGQYLFDKVPEGAFTVKVIVPGDGHPRHAQPLPVLKSVTVAAGATQQLTIDISIPPRFVDHGPCCKPYGAPPARRRVV